MINDIFSKYFNNFDVSTLIVSFDTSKNSKAPICYKSLNSILLNADITYWCQVAYQYCHELCHFCIPDGIPQKYKWLEESICELASIFFINELAHEWDKGNLHANYAQNYRIYANKILREEKCFKFNLNDLLDNDSTTFKQMSKNKYLRCHNRTVCKMLLKHFQNNPNLWKEVQKLSLIKATDNLEIYLLEWWHITDSPSKNSILSILNDFKTSCNC